RIEIDVELLLERPVAAERRLGDLGEDRRAGAADDVRGRRPADDLPARRVAAPAHVPLADVLDPVGLRPRADEIVADTGADRRRRIARAVALDCGDEELRDGNVAKVAGQPLE